MPVAAKAVPLVEEEVKASEAAPVDEPMKIEEPVKEGPKKEVIVGHTKAADVVEAAMEVEKPKSEMKKRLKRNNSKSEDEEPDLVRRGTNKKRPAMEDSDDDNNELDVTSKTSVKENKNIFNAPPKVEAKVGGKAVLGELPPGKTRRKVNKTR